MREASRKLGPPPRVPVNFDKFGRPQRGAVSRSGLTPTSTLDEVILWVQGIGLLSYTKKFTKKKVTGAKLFDMSEKQLRKLVKQEDDFVFFKRSLRQAIAYYSTTADRSRATPFRSVRRTNPLADEGNGGVLGAMDRLNRYRPEPDEHVKGGDD